MRFTRVFFIIFAFHAYKVVKWMDDDDNDDDYGKKYEGVCDVCVRDTVGYKTGMNAK